MCGDEHLAACGVGRDMVRAARIFAVSAVAALTVDFLVAYAYLVWGPWPEGAAW